MKEVSVLILFLVVLFMVSTAEGQTTERLWLVGYGYERMLPMLSGATLEVGLGESIWLSVLGGDGKATLVSPNASTYDISLRGGQVSLAKRFSESDLAGRWTIITEDGLVMHLDFKRPMESNTILLRTGFVDGGKVTLELQPLGGGFAYFTGNFSEQIYAPGDTVSLELPSDTFEKHKVELLYPGTFTLSGNLSDISYRVSFERLVGSYLVQPVREGEVIQVSFRLPEVLETGPLGIVPLRYGPLLIRVSRQGSAQPLVEMRTITVVPKSIVGLPVSSRTTLTLNSTLGTVIGVVSGTAEGKVTSFGIRPPLARLQVIEENHGRLLEEFSLGMKGAATIKYLDGFYTLYYTEYTIQNPGEGELVEPVRQQNVTINVSGFEARTWPGSLVFRPGENVTVTTRLHELRLVHIYPDGTTPTKAVRLMINGRQVDSLPVDRLLLPEGRYSIIATEPPSFNSIQLSLEGDAETRIILVDKQSELAVQRAAVILQTSLLVFFAFRVATATRRREPHNI